MSVAQTLALFARTFVIGLAVAMPVGAMGVLTIERTLHRGWRAGIATGAGIATADGGYAAIAAFGITGVSALLVSWQAPLRLVGGAALVALGLRAVLAKPAGSGPPASRLAEGDSASGIVALYTSAVGLTLTNPMTIMAFAAVFASAGLAGLTSASSALVATAGVLTGSFGWWLALVSGVALVRHGLSPHAASWFTRVSGAAIALFGLLAIVTSLT